MINNKCLILHTVNRAVTSRLVGISCSINPKTKHQHLNNANEYFCESVFAHVHVLLLLLSVWHWMRLFLSSTSSSSSSYLFSILYAQTPCAQLSSMWQLWFCSTLCAIIRKRLPINIMTFVCVSNLLMDLAFGFSAFCPWTHFHRTISWSIVVSEVPTASWMINNLLFEAEVTFV